MYRINLQRNMYFHFLAANRVSGSTIYFCFMDNTNNVLYMGKLDYWTSSALGAEHDLSYSERTIESYCFGTTTATDKCTVWDNSWITDTVSGTSTTFHYYAG